MIRLRIIFLSIFWIWTAFNWKANRAGCSPRSNTVAHVRFPCMSHCLHAKAACVNWCTPHWSVVSSPGCSVTTWERHIGKTNTLEIHCTQFFDAFFIFVFYPTQCYFFWHARIIWSDHRILTKLAFPIDLLLIVGPLAKVDMEGRRVPPNAISTSFGGCLKFKQKNNVNPRGLIPGESAGWCSPTRRC